MKPLKEKICITSLTTLKLTFDLSKSGVSSVVVLIGGRVGENALIAPRDAEPTEWADADDAW